MVVWHAWAKQANYACRTALHTKGVVYAHAIRIHVHAVSDAVYSLWSTAEMLTVVEENEGRAHYSRERVRVSCRNYWCSLLYCGARPTEEERRRKTGFRPTLVCRSWSIGVSIYSIVSFPFGRWQVYEVGAWHQCELWSPYSPYVCTGC